jgi:hypothetical protein
MENVRLREKLQIIVDNPDIIVKDISENVYCGDLEIYIKFVKRIPTSGLRQIKLGHIRRLEKELFELRKSLKEDFGEEDDKETTGS